MFVISRCLLGCDCKYDGGNNRNEDVIEFCKTHDYVTVCPETAAGLTSPREPAEITNLEDGYFKVFDKKGKDLTREFDYGSELSLQSVFVEHGSRKHGTCQIEGAILKANSPSCGTGKVYDGSFTGTLIDGNGIFADKLLYAYVDEMNNGDIDEDSRVFSPDFKICNEHNFKEIL